jgi:hypothetical protein
MYNNRAVGGGGTYQIATKLPNGDKIPHGHNMYIPNVNRIYRPFPFQDPPKFTLIGIFS